MNYRLISILIVLLVSINIVSAASVMPYDSEGEATDEFESGEDVYVYGTGFDPNDEIDVYVVDDRDDYNDGQLIDPVEKKTVTTTGSGLIILTKIWRAVLSGLYDIIADINQNGIFNFGEPVNLGDGAGFEVNSASDGEELPPNGPSEPEGQEEIPEFTTIGAGLILLFAGIYISRKRKKVLKKND